LSTIALVFGVIASMIAAASTANPSDDCVCTMTGIAPINFACSGIVGQ
jgi:hypothetical protein